MFGFSFFQLAAVGLLVLILSSGGAYIAGYERGRGIAILEQQAVNAKAIAKAAEDARALGIAEGNITFTAGQNFAEAQTKIVTRTITRIREIPVYVTPKADAACAVPVGFIRLHDDAANDHQGATIPDAAGESLDSTSDAKLSEVSAAIVSNYGTYYQIREQLISLQNWVRQQQALHATEGVAQ